MILLKFSLKNSQPEENQSPYFGINGLLYYIVFVVFFKVNNIKWK